MPIPTPRNDEKRGDFMGRCVSDLTKKGEFEDNKQRVAVCMNIFKDSESSASVEIGQGDDKKLFFNDAANENKTLNKPFRTPKGPKKFSVYVKNEKGNVVKVNFGDPNMEIKRDDPKRRKAFRSRHNCDNAGPKWKARYWSCKMWSKKSVTQMTRGSEDYEWDGESFFDHDDLLAINPSLVELEKQEQKQSTAGYGGKKYSYGSPDPMDHYFDSEEEAMKDAEKMGLKGIHTHKSEEGKTMYMAGPNHEAFMKRHEEILKEEEKSDSSLWQNIRNKRERIKRGSGEKMRKKGEKGAPTEDQVKRAKGSEG